MNKKNQNKIEAFSLIEIIVTLAIFSFIMTIVIGISITLVKAQSRIQKQMFLVQTAETTLELMSRELRFSYNYSGSTQSSYSSSPNSDTIYLQVIDPSSANTTTSYTEATTSQILSNAPDSPYVLFESQSGNPNTFSDQNAFCAYNGKLYKITKFTLESSGLNYSSECRNGQSLLPDNVTLDYISFDVYGDSSTSPKNPTVRIRFKLSSEEGGSMQMQTTVTQRLVTYF